MGRGNAVLLATRSFPTQDAATAFFKDMLARYRVGEHVSDADALDLAALLERHDEFPQKAGCGVDHFSVMMTEHGTPCFRIVRTDGSGTDFSYRHTASRAGRQRANRKSSRPFAVPYVSISMPPGMRSLRNIRTPTDGSRARSPVSALGAKATWTTGRP
jgi:hypothetical protein